MTYGHTAVATDDGHASLRGRNTSDFGQETCGTDDVEGGHTEYALRVEDTGLLEGGSDDGHGRVDGVRDDKYERLGRGLGDTGGKVANDTCVDLHDVSHLCDFERVAYNHTP